MRASFLLVASLMASSAHSARTLFLSDTDMGQLRLTPGRSTILSFPVRPTKVVLANNGSFKVEFIENDLAVSALKPQAQGNLFVYMEGRRFAFDLRTVNAQGDEIVLVRDVIERESVPSLRRKP